VRLGESVSTGIGHVGQLGSTGSGKVVGDAVNLFVRAVAVCGGCVSEGRWCGWCVGVGGAVGWPRRLSVRKITFPWLGGCVEEQLMGHRQGRHPLLVMLARVFSCDGSECYSVCCGLFEQVFWMVPSAFYGVLVVCLTGRMGLWSRCGSKVVGSSWLGVFRT